MISMMSACGVMCSDCPAFHAAEKGVSHQKRTAEAWRRIYGLNELFENISCGGCLAPEDLLFHTSLNCQARRCCRSKGLKNCAECDLESCLHLEKAQSVWDEVPEIGTKLSRQDFILYAQPYCDHRRRLAEMRSSAAQDRSPHSGPTTTLVR